MKYDVVVVGAGPAGSTAAKFLAEKGVKVLLIDKNKFPRDKPCGGGVPIRLLTSFPYIKEKNLIDSYSYGADGYLSKKQHKISLQKEEPIFATIIRKTFDHGLVKLAIDNGVTFFDNTACEDLKIEADKVNIKLSNETYIDAQIVVGADGFRSVVAKKSGLAPVQPHIGICLFQEYPVSEENLDQFFTKKRLCYLHHEVFGITGYGWVIPKKEHLNIGIGELRTPRKKVAGRTNLADLFKKYTDMLKDQNLIPPQPKIVKMQGGVVPVRPLQKTYANRVVLCGDAAGLVNPSTGGGIEYAMTSGQMAATVIAKALDIGDLSARRLSAYEKMWKKDFGKDIKLMLLIQNQWGKRMEKFAHMVGSDPKFVEMVFGILNGNLRIHKCKWKILRRLLYLYVKNLF